jgi:hypothetical protein
MGDSILERYSGEHGNAWNDENTGVGGFSNAVDIYNLTNVSIMGEIDGDSEIAFYASQDGEHFYYCDRITQTIGPVPPGPLENFAVDGASFGSNPAASLGDNANLVADAGDFAQWAKGGTINDLYIWYDFGAGNPKRVNALEMYCQMSSRAPLLFVFDASNDSANGVDGNWTTLYTQPMELNWISASTKDFEVSVPNSYRWYRVRPTKVNDNNATRINEIKLIGTEEDMPIFPKQWHIYPEVGARYIKLRSSHNVRCTATIAAK